MMSTAMTATRAKFLTALFPDPTSQIEIRTLPQGAQAFGTHEDLIEIDEYVTRAEGLGEDVYFGVASIRQEGGPENYGVTNALWADLDFKTTPEPDVRATLAACPTPPSIIVHSGGGLHVYWLLNEAISADAALRTWLRRLALTLNADMAATDVARILRLPETLNRKPEYGVPRPVTIEAFNSERRYTLADFAWLQGLVENTNGHVAREERDATRATLIQQGAEDGHRQEQLPRMVAVFYLNNPFPVARSLAHVWGKSCHPTPLTEAEVDACCDREEARRSGRESTSATVPEGAKPLGRFRKGGALDSTPITYLVQDMIPAGMLVALGGKDGRGKSLLALEIARCVLNGTSLFGRFAVRQGKVFAVLLDDPEFLIRDRLKQMGILDHPNLNIATEVDVNMDDPRAMLAWLANRLKDERPALIIIDALYLFVPDGGASDKGNSTGAMKPIMVAMNAISTVTGATTLLVAHDNKAGGDIAGSGSIRNMFKAILRVLLPPEAEQAASDEVGTAERILQLNKLKTGKPATWRLRLDGPGAWTFHGTAQAYRAQAIEETILGHLAETGPMPADALAKAIKKRDRDVGEACRNLAAAGRLKTGYRKATKQGGAAILYRTPNWTENRAENA